MKQHQVFAVFLVALLVAFMTTLSAAPEKLDSQVSITRVWPEKLFYHPDETARGTVELSNPTDKSVKVSLECLLEHDLESASSISRRTLALKPQSGETVAVQWKAGPEEGGYALVARVTQAKEQLAERREYFAVADCFVRVGQTSGSPVFSFEEKQIKHLAEVFAPSLRASYVNSCLRFGWAPDDFSELTPSEPDWISGQGRYHESARGLKALIEACHKNGIAIYAYAKAYCVGPVGLEFARRHPDWVGWNAQGHFDFSEYLYTFREPLTFERFGLKTPWAFIPMCFVDRKALDFFMDEVIASVRQFGWDGVFFDSNFPLYGTHDVTGRPHTERGFMDIPTVSNTRYAKKRLWDGLGRDFGIGYNFYNGVRNAWLMGEFREASAGGAWPLYEEANKLTVEDEKNAWNLWRYFANAVGHCARCTRDAGGECYVGYLLQGCPAYAKHSAAIVLASGAHMATCLHHGSPRTEYVDVFRLATRFAHLLYGPEVRSLPRHAYRAAVTSSRELWWEDYTYERPAPGGGRDVIVHLVNSPATERCSRFKQPEPPPASNVRVSIEVPEGAQLAGCWALVLDEPLQRPLEPLVQGRRVTVSIPDFKYWTICVFRLR